jgi:hypothetical protein
LLPSWTWFLETRTGAKISCCHRRKSVRSHGEGRLGSAKTSRCIVRTTGRNRLTAAFANVPA